MRLKTLIIIFISLTNAAFSQSQNPESNILLEDGFVITTGIEGQVQDSNDESSWFFELNTELSDENSVLKPGTRLQLLPSTTLERIITFIDSRVTDNYRLRGIITTYKNTNYFFPTYFEAIRIDSAEEPNSLQASNQEVTAIERNETPLAIVDSNNVVTLPPEVMDRFQTVREEAQQRGQRIADSNSYGLGNILHAETDAVLLDKTCVLYEQDGEYKITLDYLGRNISQVSFHLLPCAMLELAEQKQSTNFETIRFNVSGIITEFDGKNYLLLNKAVRLYDYGNFGQ